MPAKEHDSVAQSPSSGSCSVAVDTHSGSEDNQLPIQTPVLQRSSLMPSAYAPITSRTHTSSASASNPTTQSSSNATLESAQASAVGRGVQLDDQADEGPDESGFVNSESTIALARSAYAVAVAAAATTAAARPNYSERFDHGCRFFLLGPQSLAVLYNDEVMLSSSLRQLFSTISNKLHVNHLQVIIFQMPDANPPVQDCRVQQSHDDTYLEGVKRILFHTFVTTYKKDPHIPLFRIIVRASQESLPAVIVPQPQPHPQPQPQPRLISLRFQVDGRGAVSQRFPISNLMSRNNVDFFSWFASQSGHWGKPGPNTLKFSLKDTIPEPLTNTITRGNEEHFRYMKNDILPMYQATAGMVPGLSEFAVLVTVPCWQTI